MLNYSSYIFFGIFISLFLASIIYFSGANPYFIAWIAFWFFLFLITSRTEKNILSPIWIVFFYLLTYFFIRPSFFLLNESTPYLFNNFAQDLNPILSTFIFVNIAYLPLIFGYYFGDKFKSESTSIKNERYSESFLLLITIVIQVLVMISAAILVINFQGIANIISIQSALVKAIPESGFIIKLAFIFILISFLPPALMLARYGLKFKVFAIAIFNILLCLIFGRRLAIISIFVPFITYYYFYKNKFSAYTGLAMYVVALFLLTSIVAFRISNSAEAGISIIEESAEFFVWDMVLSVMNSYGADTDLRYGLDFLPKQLLTYLELDGGLSDYPSIGESLVSVYFPFFQAGIPPGIFGLFYMQGGFFGLAILSFLLGIFLRTIFNYFTKEIHNKVFFLTIFPFFIITTFHFVRVGDFWRIIISQGRIFLLLYIIYYIINNFRFYKTSYGK